MAAYKWNGAVQEVEGPAPVVRAPRVLGFDPSACGTNAGYSRHRRYGVPPCQDCKDAQAAYHRDRYVKLPPPAFTPDACGTWAGWQRHRTFNVEFCEPCREAAREYQRERRALRKVA